MENINYLPYVLAGDKNYTDQSNLFIIYDGDPLYGHNTISSDVDDGTTYGSLNQTSIELYYDILELQNNDKILLDNINEVQLNLNTKAYLLGNVDESITGHWNFNICGINTASISNTLTFKNTYGVNTIMNQRNDTSGILDYNSTFSPLALQTNTIQLYTNDSSIPDIVPEHGVLFIDPTSDFDLKLLYPDGTSLTLGSKAGNNAVVTSDLVKDVSTSDGTTVSAALLDRPTFEQLNSSQTKVYQNKYDFMGSDVFTYLTNVSDTLFNITSVMNYWIDVKLVLNTHINSSDTDTYYNALNINVNDRVLLINQNNPIENGIYYRFENALIRTADANTSEQFTHNKFIKSKTPDADGNQYFRFILSTDNFILNSSDITFLSTNDTYIINNIGVSNNVTCFDIHEDDYTIETNSINEEYATVVINHNLSRHIAKPDFMDEDGVYLDVIIKRIDMNNVRIQIGEPTTGKLIVT